MKKYLILLIMTTAVGFTSCSDDDEDQDRVIGTWILQSVEPSSLYDPEACAGKNSTVEIEGNNILTATFYFTQTNCVASAQEGTWQKTGASSYTFDFPGLDPVTGTVTYPGTDRMVFTGDNGEVFTFQRQL